MGYYGKSRILISAPDFLKNIFQSPMIEMGKNFKEIVFPMFSEHISRKSLIIVYRYIDGCMTDAENLEKISAEKLFAPDEWARVLYCGVFLEIPSFFKSENMNISYLKIEKEIYAVYALLKKDGVWRFGANPIDDNRRDDLGRRLFSLHTAFI